MFSALDSSQRVRLRSITNTQGSPSHRLTYIDFEDLRLHAPPTQFNILGSSKIVGSKLYFEIYPKYKNRQFWDHAEINYCGTRLGGAGPAPRAQNSLFPHGPKIVDFYILDIFQNRPCGDRPFWDSQYILIKFDIIVHNIQ